MGATLLITLREGIEAALVISIILAYLNAIGRRDQHGIVWAGTGAAVSLSFVARGGLFATAGALPDEAEEAFEGIASLLAVAVLTWMIFWMRRQARFLKGELQERVDVALASGSALALPALAFVVVVREGLETVLFLFSAIRTTAEGSVALGYVGAALGLVVAAVLGYLIYRGGIRLNLRTFFKVTGALILVVAAGLLAGGIHDLQEVGWITFGTATAFDISGVLSDEGTVGALLRALFGYNADPTVLELVAWVGYLLVTGFLFLRPHRERPAAPPAAPRTPAEE